MRVLFHCFILARPLIRLEFQWQRRRFLLRTGNASVRHRGGRPSLGRDDPGRAAHLSAGEASQTPRETAGEELAKPSLVSGVCLCVEGGARVRRAAMAKGLRCKTKRAFRAVKRQHVSATVEKTRMQVLQRRLAQVQQGLDVGLLEQKPPNKFLYPGKWGSVAGACRVGVRPSRDVPKRWGLSSGLTVGRAFSLCAAQTLPGPSFHK